MSSTVLIHCMECGRKTAHRRGQKMKGFCSEGCEQEYIFRHGPPRASLPPEPEPEPAAVDGLTDHDRTKILSLIALANNAAAPFGESANAAREACKRIERLGALAPPKPRPRRNPRRGW